MTHDTSPRLEISRTGNTITLTVYPEAGEPAVVRLSPSDASLAGNTLIADALGQLPEGARGFSGAPEPEEDPKPSDIAPVVKPSIFARSATPADPAPQSPSPAPEDAEVGPVEAPTSESPISVPEGYEPLLAPEKSVIEWRVSRAAAQRGEALKISQEQMLAAVDAPERIDQPSPGVLAYIRDGVSVMIPEEGEAVIIGVAWATGHVPDTGTPRAHSGGSGRRMPSSYQELRQLLVDHQFVVEESSGHPKVRHPDHPGVMITVAGSTSDRRAYQNIISRVRREFGIDISAAS